MTRSALLSRLLFSFAFAGLALVIVAAQQPAPQRASVFTAAQAQSGQAIYAQNCSACHGTRGQGVPHFPKLTGVGSKPRRSVEDIIGLLNDPKAYGLELPMKSYADKLTEEEKREIAEWVASLKVK